MIRVIVQDMDRNINRNIVRDIVRDIVKIFVRDMVEISIETLFEILFEILFDIIENPLNSLRNKILVFFKPPFLFSPFPLPNLTAIRPTNYDNYLSGEEEGGEKRKG